MFSKVGSNVDVCLIEGFVGSKEGRNVAGCLLRCPLGFLTFVGGSFFSKVGDVVGMTFWCDGIKFGSFVRVNIWDDGCSDGLGVGGVLFNDGFSIGWIVGVFCFNVGMKVG